MPLQQELPEQFGRYHILKKLGAGGMGAVYLAEDAKLRRKVALKVPHFTAGTRVPGLDRFQREARLAAGIDHPNFCPVYDVDEVDGIHFFTMAYLEGTPLADLVGGEQPWPPLQAVDMVRRVALAVGELHSRGIVHRDLKPANVMVRPSGEPVLMDFGLACSLTSQSERLTGTGEVLGTLAYMPPEQLEGDRTRLGPAEDVYSLGMILYELLTGQLPFTGPPLLVVAQVGSKVPEPPSARQPGLDARLDAICLKALAKKPEERFPDMPAFVAALEEFLYTQGEQRLNCPQCSQPLKVSAAMAGKRLKCPRCGTSLMPATMAQPRPGPLSSRQETIPPTFLETATRPPRQPATIGRRGPLLLLLLMVVVTGVVLTAGIIFLTPRDEATPEPKAPVTEAVQKKEVAPPPRMATLRLDRLEPVRIKAGQRRALPIRVRRQNCPGPVQVVAATALENVSVQGQVDEGTEEGILELVVLPEAKGSERVLRLRAFALATAARAEGELSLTIQAAEGSPPPPRPSLHLEDLGAVTVDAGKKKTVSVKLKREHCPGPVQVELAEAASGVTVRNGLVRDGTDEGSLELNVASDAPTGERTLRLRAVAAAANAEGELRLTVGPAETPPPKPSLLLEDLTAVTVDAGKRKTVYVKIRRQRCPGPVEVRLAEPSSGVKVLHGLVGNDSEEGSLVLEVASYARAGERTLHLQAVAAAASADGELKLTIQPAERFTAPSITGTYHCVGDNGDGTGYNGKVTIWKTGDTYLLEWSIGKQTHVGIGMLNGRTLSSSWATMTDGKLLKGVVVYKVEKNKLVGEWAQYPGTGKVLTETLTKER